MRPAPRTAKERLRVRMKARLEELGITARELARDCGKSDGWISGVLAGSQGVQLEMLDAIADRLGIPVGELVREDHSQLTELRPNERAVLTHFRAWPGQVQERFLRLLDYFASSSPDPESQRFVDLLMGLPKGERRRLLSYLRARLHTGRNPQMPGLEPDLPDPEDG